MGKPSSLIKPTLNTLFHIDYDWWERESAEDLRSYLLSHLMQEQREQLSQINEDRVIDYVSPETGEIFQLDEIGVAIQKAAQAPDFIDSHTPLVDSIFRVFLANGNVPLSPKDLSETLDRPATIILKTLSGTRVYKGIRPYNP